METIVLTRPDYLRALRYAGSMWAREVVRVDLASVVEGARCLEHATTGAR